MTPKFVYTTKYNPTSGPDALLSRYPKEGADLIMALQARVDAARGVGQPIPLDVYLPVGDKFAHFEFAREEARGIYYTLKA